MKHTIEEAVAALEAALPLMGTRQKDLVTGFGGVVTSVCYDISGCIQVALSPPLDKDGKRPEGLWIDTDRLMDAGERAMDPFNMERPEASTRGPAEKPAK